MIRHRTLFILSIIYFFIGIGIILNFFLIEPVDVAELSANSPAYHGEDIKVLGYLSPSELQLDSKINFEVEVFTYTLEKEGERVLVVSPEEAEGFVLVKGRFIALDPDLGVPSFIYATNLRGARDIEKLGISKEGLLILAIYFIFSGATFLYELKKTPRTTS